MKKFNRDEVFKAVDESSKRFDKYTDAERKKFAAEARVARERAEEEHRRITDNMTSAAIISIM